MASTSLSTTAALIVLLAITAITVTEAQGNAGSNIPSCASKLVPCAQYIANTTEKPPATCCDPIKETVKTELTCLCNLYNTPGFLASLGINVTQAVGLTTRCGISADTSSCSKVVAQSPGASAVPTPPSRATENTNSNSNSGSSKMAWAGFSSMLLIFAASSFF